MGLGTPMRVLRMLCLRMPFAIRSVLRAVATSSELCASSSCLTSAHPQPPKRPRTPSTQMQANLSLAMSFAVFASAGRFASTMNRSHRASMPGARHSVLLCRCWQAAQRGKRGRAIAALLLPMQRRRAQRIGCTAVL
jgi:hypothetical protein